MLIDIDRRLILKISKYNIIVEHNNKKLAFNSRTCALAEVNERFSSLLNSIESKNFKKENLSEKDLKLFENMKKGGFIIDDCLDEIELLKFHSYQGRFNTDSLRLTIAPTFNCNFACPYCYENTKNEFMSKSVIDAICKEVHDAAEYKKRIYITWYGGEPLLAKNIVWSLSEQFLEDCEKFGAKYFARIITNGYLIDDETVEKFKNYKITKAQVTIDGPPDIHNKRRKLKNSPKPTFETILKNTKKLLDAGIQVDIRINVDKTNEDRIEELLDILLSYHLENTFVYLGPVKPYTEFCQSISATCLSPKSSALKFVDTEKLLLKKGFKSDNYPWYPQAESNNCGADSISSKVIAPDGSMYKCWHDMSFPDKSIGNIKDSSKQNGKNIMTQINYMLFNPFKHEKCLQCNIFPICKGGCPTTSNGVSCKMWKYNLEETLKIKYDVSLKK